MSADSLRTRRNRKYNYTVAVYHTSIKRRGLRIALHVHGARLWSRKPCTMEGIYGPRIDRSYG